MKLLNKENLMLENPTELHRIKNRFSQEVVFYEHPIYGDEHSVIGVINDTAFDTGFMDCGDFKADSDYNPILYDGKVFCSYVIDSDFIDKGLFKKELLG